MPDYYTKAEVDTAHQEIVDNMTTQLNSMRDSLNKNLDNKVSGLATRDDADEIKSLLKNINWGVSFFKVSGKTLSWIGSIVAGLAIMVLAIKFGVLWLIHWVTK